MHRPGMEDICPINGKMYIRLRAGKGELQSVRLIYNCNKFNWWKYRKTAEMSVCFSDSEFCWYSVSVPLTDTRLGYIFKFTTAAGETCFFSEEGVTARYDHKLSFFNYFQYTSQFEGEHFETPEWARHASAYQIFPERFAAGIKNNIECHINTAWGEKPTPKSFCGGDLVGIKQKLPYLKALGVTLIYLTPVFCSVSNHKYDIFDYENVDPAFGGNEALRAFISDAHKEGMRVMLDGVFNHCSHLHPFFLDVCKKGRTSEYYDWFYIEGDKPDFKKGNYLKFASVNEMPKLNTLNPKVIDYFTGIAVHWMRDYGADAWRLDVSDELSHHFLRAFRDAVRKEKPDTIIIGEDWHNAARYLIGDEYDGTMNYGFTKACLDLIAFEKITPSEFCDRIIRLYCRQNAAASRQMLNLLDSHDTDRFITRCKGNAQKYRAAAALCFFYPGIPCVYYGDEIGIEGGYDPDCRRCFDWDSGHWNIETQALIRRLMGMRKEKPLADGSFSVTEENGIITLVRKAGSKSAVLRLNGTNKEREGLPPYGFTID